MPIHLIAHILLENKGKYLVIKRSKVKRGLPNVYPEYWDIPGGRVEENELPQAGAIREAWEESNQRVKLTNILYEDSQFDKEKKAVFTRLVYQASLLEEREVLLDPEEHTNFRWISSLKEMKGELLVPYLWDILP